MKCPKCGYVSFEYLDQCRKCGKSVEAFKSEHGLYGYPPKDLMLVQYLEDKASAEEESSMAGTVELGDEDENLEDIVSNLGSASGEAGTDEEDAGLSLDLGESEEAPEKIAAELSATTAPVEEEKESGIELTLDDAGAEEPAPVELKAEPEKPASEDDSEGISLSLEDVEAEVDAAEVDVAEAPVEKPAEGTDPDEDEITLDMDDIEADIEIDAEITVEEPKKEKKKKEKKKENEDSGDEITLELD